MSLLVGRGESPWTLIESGLNMMLLGVELRSKLSLEGCGLGLRGWPMNGSPSSSERDRDRPWDEGSRIRIVRFTKTLHYYDGVKKCMHIRVRLLSLPELARRRSLSGSSAALRDGKGIEVIVEAMVPPGAQEWRLCMQ